MLMQHAVGLTHQQKGNRTAAPGRVRPAASCAAASPPAVAAAGARQRLVGASNECNNDLHQGGAGA